MKVINIVFIALLAAAAGCAPSTHETTKSELGQISSSDEMLRATQSKGVTVSLTRVDSARWKVDRAGLINLEHERAKAAGVESGLEPIVVSFFAVEHPRFGRFIIDSGVSKGFRDRENPPVSPLVASVMNLDLLEIEIDTLTWVEEQGGINGVFLTHIHMDHVMGLPDVADHVPVWAGPGETSPRQFVNMFVQGTLDGLFAEKSALREWQFEADPSGRFAGVVDVFGDGSLWAIHTPGHTPGHTSYLAKTPDGPVLITGDASHTEWGWDHCVEPGEFNYDGEGAAESLTRLRALETEMPGLVVELGHQHHGEHTEESCGGTLAELRH